MTDITGCAITLSPGTWMIWAQSNQGPGGSYSYAVVQTGGSGSGTAISQGEDNGADGAGRITIAIVPTFITPTVTTSYHLRGQMGGGGTFYANPNSFGPGNFIAALRIGG